MAALDCIWHITVIARHIKLPNFPVCIAMYKDHISDGDAPDLTTLWVVNASMHWVIIGSGNDLVQTLKQYRRIYD